MVACYNAVMSMGQQKHIAPRATAEEITKAVGVTEADRRIVRKVLMEMGYLPEPSIRTDRARQGRRRTNAGSF